MTKTKVIWISLVGAIAFLLIAGTRGVPWLCAEFDRACMKQYDGVSLFFLIFLTLFLLSLITYFLREEVFRAWLRFTYWWLPLSLVMIYLSAGNSGGGFGMPNILDQEFVAIIFSVLFATISIILIVVKSLLLRGK